MSGKVHLPSISCVKIIPSSSGIKSIVDATPNIFAIVLGTCSVQLERFK